MPQDSNQLSSMMPLSPGRSPPKLRALSPSMWTVLEGDIASNTGAVPVAVKNATTLTAPRTAAQDDCIRPYLKQKGQMATVGRGADPLFSPVHPYRRGSYPVATPSPSPPLLSVPSYEKTGLCTCRSVEIEVLPNSFGLELECRYSHNGRLVCHTWKDCNLDIVAKNRNPALHGRSRGGGVGSDYYHSYQPYQQRHYQRQQSQQHQQRRHSSARQCSFADSSGSGSISKRSSQDQVGDNGGHRSSGSGADFSPRTVLDHHDSSDLSVISSTEEEMGEDEIKEDMRMRRLRFRPLHARGLSDQRVIVGNASAAVRGSTGGLVVVKEVNMDTWNCILVSVVRRQSLPISVSLARSASTSTRRGGEVSLHGKSEGDIARNPISYRSGDDSKEEEAAGKANVQIAGGILSSTTSRDDSYAPDFDDEDEEQEQKPFIKPGYVLTAVCGHDVTHLPFQAVIRVLNKYFRAGSPRPCRLTFVVHGCHTHDVSSVGSYDKAASLAGLVDKGEVKSPTEQERDKKGDRGQSFEQSLFRQRGSRVRGGDVYSADDLLAPLPLLMMGDECICSQAAARCPIFSQLVLKLEEPYLGLVYAHVCLFDRQALWEHILSSAQHLHSRGEDCGDERDWTAIKTLIDANKKLSNDDGSSDGNGYGSETGGGGGGGGGEEEDGKRRSGGDNDGVGCSEGEAERGVRGSSLLGTLLPAEKLKALRYKYVALRGVRIEPASSQLERDVERTKGCGVTFTPDQQAVLFRVTNSVLVGNILQYSQGMTYIGAIIVVQETDEATAFAVFSYLLDQPLIQAIFRTRQVPVSLSRWGSVRTHIAAAEGDDDKRKRPALKSAASSASLATSSWTAEIDKTLLTALALLMETLEVCLKVRLPELYAHFRAHEIQISFMATEWFMCLFCKATSLPLAVAIIDLCLVMDDVILRAALALFEALTPTLLSMGRVTLLKKFPFLTAQVKHEEILMRIMSIHLPRTDGAAASPIGQLRYLLQLLSDEASQPQAKGCVAS